MAEDTAIIEVPPKQEARKPVVDPDLAQLYRDFGKVLEDDKPPEKKTLPVVMPSTTLGEAVANAEAKRKEQEDADKNKPADEEAKDEKDIKDQNGEEKDEPKEVQKPAETPAPVVELRAKTTEKELRELVDKRVSDAMSKMPPQAPAKEPAKQEEKLKAEDEYEKSLGEIELEELRFAMFAAQKDPTLKEYPKQLVEYFKKAEAYGEKVRKEDPERMLDNDTDEEWKKWQRENRPKVSPVLRRKLEREQILEEATLAAEAKLQTKYAAVEKRQELLEKRPVIEKITQEFSAGLNDLMEATPEGEESLVAPIAKRAKEVGWGKATEEDPLFAPIVQRVTYTANALASDYLAIVNGTKDLDLSNENHAWLSKFITDQGEDFAKKGGDATVRVDNLGKRRQFLPRHKFAEIANSDPAFAAQFWTWNDADILNRIALNARKNVVNMIKVENDKLARAGFERRKPEPAKKDLPKSETKPIPEQKGSGSPKAPSSVAPGVAQQGKVNTPPGAYTAEEIKVMFPEAQI